MSRYSDPALPLPAPQWQAILVDCRQYHLPGEAAFIDKAPSASTIAKHVRLRATLDAPGLLEQTAFLGSHWPRLLLEVRRVEHAALKAQRDKVRRDRRKELLKVRRARNRGDGVRALEDRVGGLFEHLHLGDLPNNPRGGRRESPHP
ncbi:MAG: hypothetical protein GY772_22975, partial [bacterium]|nr:hypothetical protein [bacterium]